MSTETETLIPDREIVYSGFRAALVVTLDCLLRQSVRLHRPVLIPAGGFLDRIPLLQSTAPQIQLELLCSTWQAVRDEPTRELSTQEECVLHASLETLADLSLRCQDGLLQMAWRSPRPIRLLPDVWLVSRIRALQVLIPSPNLAKFANIRQWTELSPAHSSSEISIEERTERRRLLDLLGRWVVCENTLYVCSELFNSAEASLIQAFFEEHPALRS